MFPNSIDALNNYFSLMNSNGVARVFHTSRETGILTAIMDTPLSVDEVCQRCQTQSRGTQLVLNVLVAIGAADLDDERYQATPLVKMLLNSGYRDLGDTYWNSLESFLRDGNPIAKMDAPEQSEMHYQQQAAGLAWMMAPAAKAAAQYLLSSGTRNALRILDVGAGAASWSLAIAAGDSETRVVAVDWPAVLQVATQTAHLTGLQDQLTCLPGNYHDVALEQENFDIAIVANVTHLETEDRTLSLMKRLYQALKPGGEVVIIDALPDSRDGDKTTHALYALGLALRTEQGKVHSRQTLETLLTQAGFAAPQYQALPVAPHMMGMLVAEKPKSV